MTQPATAPDFVYDRPKDAPLGPSPLLVALRDEKPVTRVSVWNGKLEAWLVTRWEEAREVLGSPALSTNPNNPGFPAVREGVRQRERGFFQMWDPPVHTAMRRTLTREFMVKKMDALRPAVARITTDLLDDLVKKSGPVDYVEHFALPLPSLVICELLGVPYEHHEFFQENSKPFVDLTATAEQVTEAYARLSGFLKELLAVKRTNPGDDVVTRLGEQVDAGDITEQEAADLGALLLFAGHETTANMIALSTITLLENPEQIPRLFGTPDELNNAVEELLRYISVLHGGLRRVATEDLTIGDVTIRAGEGVIVPLSVVNRDPALFTDPDELALDRSNARQHLAFGYGIHQCLGQPLARAELQIVLPEVFRRLPELKLAAPLEEIPFKASSMVYGVQELPVTW
ncbi:cytochrome P450 [Streptomyces sp. NPDC057253]|uniref:cytochrome P450 n=1 Tax=Streptomyces sp. NPDC057253 TaxID=3346069 RepID=UPI003640F41F